MKPWVVEDVAATPVTTGRGSRPRHGARRPYGVAGLLLLAIVSLPAWPETSGPPRAAIASAHPLATEAGFEILSEGGNAFDAAVAVTAALAVVEPNGSGLGGGGFWLLHRAEDGLDVMIDGREVAPGQAHRDMYLDQAGNPVSRMSVDGPIAAGIPGQPAAMAHLASHYGRLPLARSLAPAILIARQGFPVYARLQSGFRFKQKLLLRWPEGARIFLPGGEVPELGYVIRQPELAETLELLAREGPSGFYGGEFAARLVQGVREAGGIWTLEDLAAYRVVERKPLSGEYRGMRIVSAPPPSSGGVALINALNILAGYDLSEAGPVIRKHLVAEAMRRVFRDRAQYLGDPDFVEVPVGLLTSPAYAVGQRTSIRKDRATRSEELPGVVPWNGQGTQTTHFSILDKDGNRVGASMSLNFWFGCGFMAPGTGVMINNEMDDFSVKPGVPNGYELIGGEANAIAPRKRMLSSMTPTFLETDDGLAILGTPGGSRIISMVLLAALAWQEGMAPGDIVELPRYHHQYLPDVLSWEPGSLDETERRALESLGHTLKETSRPYGNMQIVTWDYASGRVEGASDPRGEGEARVY